MQLGAERWNDSEHVQVDWGLAGRTFARNAAKAYSPGVRTGIGAKSKDRGLGSASFKQ